MKTAQEALSRLIIYIEQRKGISLDSYQESNDKFAQQMYMGENTAYGMVLMEINKVLDQTPLAPAAGSAERPAYYDTVVNALKEIRNYLHDDVGVSHMYIIADNALKNIEQFASTACVGEGEAVKVFDNNTDCYADTWEDNHDTVPPIKIEGEVIPAMTKEAFLKAIKSLQQLK